MWKDINIQKKINKNARVQKAIYIKEQIYKKNFLIVQHNKQFKYKLKFNVMVLAYTFRLIRKMKIDVYKRVNSSIIY